MLTDQDTSKTIKNRPKFQTTEHKNTTQNNTQHTTTTRHDTTQHATHHDTTPNTTQHRAQHYNTEINTKRNTTQLYSTLGGSDTTESLLGQSWAILGPLGTAFGLNVELNVPDCAMLRATLRAFGRSWSLLGRSPAILGPLGGLLGPLEVLLGPNLMPRRPLGRFSDIL